jgi:hypothetical protein
MTQQQINRILGRDNKQDVALEALQILKVARKKLTALGLPEEYVDKQIGNAAFFIIQDFFLHD